MFRLLLAAALAAMTALAGASVECVAVEPAEALHGLEGLKHMASSLVPEIFDPKLPDEILSVSTDAGWDMSNRLAAPGGIARRPLDGRECGGCARGRQARRSKLCRRDRVRPRRPVLCSDEMGETL